MGVLSRSDNTVEPVVVRPDIASKNASVRLISDDESQRGKLAKREIVIQLAVVRTNVSLTLNLKSGSLKANSSPTPTKTVAAADLINSGQTFPYAAASAIAGNVMDTASTISNRPITYKEDRRSSTSLNAEMLFLYIST